MRKKKIDVVPEVAVEKDQTTKKSSAKEASVMSMQGQHIRTYTKADHGEDFEKMAKGFSTKNPGSSVVVR